MASGDGPTQTSPASPDPSGEAGVLGQEAVAGVHRLGAGLPGRLEHGVGVAVALRRGGRADRHGLVGLADVGQAGVGLGVHRDRAQAHPLDGADDAAGDLASVGDEHGLEHGGLASRSDVVRQARLTGVVLVLVVAVGALAVLLATGGTRLARVRIRAVRLLVAAAVVQLGTSVLAPGSGFARVRRWC